MKVRIIGAGFSGLAMGYALTKRGAQVEIYEKSEQVGGLLGSQRLGWGLVENAANGIRASKNVVQLFNDIDLSYLKMNKEHRKRFIFRGVAKQIPLSPLEITRMSVGLFRRPTPRPGQSLESYAESIFGYGAAQYLIEPVMFGIFADNAKNLSATLIYNYFFKHNSVKSSEARGTLAPGEGMQALTESMKSYIEKKGGIIHVSKTADILEGIPTIIATDAISAAEILAKKDEWVSSQLARVKYLPLSSVTLAYKQTTRDLKGFGCLFPAREGFSALGVLFNNDIFEERGPYLTETWMVGGDNFDESYLKNTILKDRARLVGQTEAPDEVVIHSWPRALPQYSVELEKMLQSLVLPGGIYLAGNYLGRMGLAKILDQCHETADRILSHES